LPSANTPAPPLFYRRFYCRNSVSVFVTGTISSVV